jgi:leucyl-tRNA synthetase
MRHNISAIEKKWQAYWERQQLFAARDTHEGKKYYVLDMFPYPSGEGLHVGHPLGYVASDVVARHKWAQGYNVLHPMGFDAFGLPAEQYATETGQHPAVTTQKNMARYEQQLKALGLGFDWQRAVCTSDPSYYRWTQWLFLQFFESWYNSAASRAEPLQTLVDHLAKQGNIGLEAACDADTPSFDSVTWCKMSPEEQQQILLHYRLAYLSDLQVNWCPVLGTVLANEEVVGGRSERGGHLVEQKMMRQWCLRITAYADRLLAGLDTIDWPTSIQEIQRNWIGRSEGATIPFALAGSKQEISIFTTRPETIYGVSYLALAPEHPLVDHLLAIASPAKRKALTQYLATAALRSERDRMAEKVPHGIDTGLKVIHPLTEQPLPLWIGDYVLAGYGTGAIMGVPAHDERDRLFATHFHLTILPVIAKEGSEASDLLIHSPGLDGLTVPAAKAAVITQLVAEGKGRATTNYRLRDAIFSRQRYWGEPFPICYQEELPYALDEAQLPLELPFVDAYKPTATGHPPLARAKEWHTAAGHKLECNTMPGWAGSSWYFLRYMDPHNTEAFASRKAINYWQAVDLYIGGAEHATGHLLYARFFTHFLYDRGYISFQEPFQKLINQGMIQGVSAFLYRIKDSKTFVSSTLQAQYDTTRMHVAIHLLDDKNCLNISKFRQWRSDLAEATFIEDEGKVVCAREVEKMSKSKYNTVSPDEVIAAYGADTLRVYELFLGPIRQTKPWSQQSIAGIARFLAKVWRLLHDEQDNFHCSDEAATEAELKVIHAAIKQVDEDIASYSFNTAISRLMIAAGELGKLACDKKAILRDYLRLLAPFAPHIAEELWSLLGEEGSILHGGWPALDAAYTVEDHVIYPIAVGGKKRTTLELPRSTSPAELEAHALKAVAHWLQGRTPKRIIVVPGRMVNVVV